MAPFSLEAHVASSVSSPCRLPTYRCRHPSTDPPDLEEEPALGRGHHRRRACQARPRRLPKDGCQVPAHLPRGRGQKWSTSIRNHIDQTWAADWFNIVPLRFQVLYALVILYLGRREVVRLGVTPTPSTQYAAQSFVEAVCDRDDQAPRFLIHDRDSICGVDFRRRVKGFGTRCLATPPRAPTANAFCE